MRGFSRSVVDVQRVHTPGTMNEVLSGGTDVFIPKNQNKKLCKKSTMHWDQGNGGERRKFAPSNSKSMNEDTNSGA